MTGAAPLPVLSAAAQPEPAYDWTGALNGSGPQREEALRLLHRFLLRAAFHQVSRMRAALAGAGSDRVEEIANQAADEAMVTLLSKLSTFEGRSRFTTWAYKFAVLQAAVEVRRQAWHGREVPLDESYAPPDRAASPEQHALAADLAGAVRLAMDQVLTPHQRSIAVALLVDEVPIDVLADRLGTTRNALYKTLHDARNRLRAHLVSTGHLVPTTTTAGAL